MALIIATLVAAVGIYLWDKPYFYQRFAVEDGPVENATAIFLLVSSLVLALNAVRLTTRLRIIATLLTAFYALMFFVAAGEEISWGQRIFGWQSSDFFLTHNSQAETNLHNLTIGGVHLAKTLFGSGLTVAILLYLVVLPVLYRQIPRVARVVNRLAIPLAHPRHAIIAIAASLIILVLDVPRKWEVYELIFSLLAVSIFLRPQNRQAVAGGGA
jgi:hypothetical protein